MRFFLYAEIKLTYRFWFQKITEKLQIGETGKEKLHKMIE